MTIKVDAIDELDALLKLAGEVGINSELAPLAASKCDRNQTSCERLGYRRCEICSCRHSVLNREREPLRHDGRWCDRCQRPISSYTISTSRVWNQPGTDHPGRNAPIAEIH